MGINEKAFAVSMICGIIGVLFAIMVQMMNTAGIIINEFITPSLTLRDFQFVIIVVWVMIGIVCAVVEKNS